MKGIRKLKAEGPYKSQSVSENYQLPVLSLQNSIFPDKEESHNDLPPFIGPLVS